MRQQTFCPRARSFAQGKNSGLWAPPLVHCAVVVAAAPQIYAAQPPSAARELSPPSAYEFQHPPKDFPAPPSDVCPVIGPTIGDDGQYDASQPFARSMAVYAEIQKRIANGEPPLWLPPNEPLEARLLPPHTPVLNCQWDGAKAAEPRFQPVADALIEQVRRLVALNPENWNFYFAGSQHSDAWPKGHFRRQLTASIHWIGEQLVATAEALRRQAQPLVIGENNAAAVERFAKLCAGVSSDGLFYFRHTGLTPADLHIEIATEQYKEEVTRLIDEWYPVSYCDASIDRAFEPAHVAVVATVRVPSLTEMVGKRLPSPQISPAWRDDLQRVWRDLYWDYEPSQHLVAGVSGAWMNEAGIRHEVVSRFTDKHRWFNPDEEEDPEWTYLHSLGVAQGWEGQRLGYLMTREVMREVVRRHPKVRALVLTVIQCNDSALKAYRNWAEYCDEVTIPDYYFCFDGRRSAVAILFNFQQQQPRGHDYWSGILSKFF